MTNNSAVPASAVALVDPHPDQTVFPLHQLRPGVSAQEASRFGEMRWELNHLHHGDTARSKAFLWSNFPPTLRASFMRIAWAIANIPLPEVLHNRLGSRTRQRLSPSSLMSILTNFRHFAHWLERRSITRLEQVDLQTMEQYAQHLVDAKNGATSDYDERRLFTLSRIWAYAPFLLEQDRLATPPWEIPGAAILDFLGDDFCRDKDGENQEAAIHPATMAPMLVWALRLVLDLAPDIIGAGEERQALFDRIAPTAETSNGSQIVRLYLEQLRTHGKGLPSYQGVPGGGRPRNGVDRVNRNYIAGLLGVTLNQVSRQVDSLPLSELIATGFEAGAPLPGKINGRIDGQPWIDAIDYAEAQPLTVHLVTAAVLVVGYLSGMRPDEVLSLERGCVSEDEREDGTLRYSIAGRHFKGVTDDNGNTLPGGRIRSEPWTVVRPVERAVRVMEELHDDRLIFPRSITVRRRKPDPMLLPAEGLAPNVVKPRIASFISWANEQALRLGRPHELIPADPQGEITLRRLRRTVAWFIYRQPGGRVALGLQYGHVGSSLAESYGGRTKSDMLDVLDFEKTLALADSLAEASDRINAGEHVSGPAADRYVASAHEYSQRYSGGFLTPKQMKELRNNPRLQVFEDPEALLTCNFDPYKALCDPGLATPGSQTLRTPNRSRCNPACQNISRTDTHMHRAREMVDAIDAELADPLTTHPLRVRLQDCRATTITIVADHQAATPPLPSSVQDHQ